MARPGTVVVVLAVVMGLGLSSSTASARALAEDRAPVVTFLRPGTMVESIAPKGWTYLVLKSIPRIESGEVDTLPAIALRTATMFRTVIVADVRRPAGEQTFRLVRIGLGLCVPYDGVDTVVTASDDTPARAALGFVESQVLARAEQELRKGRLLAYTPTFALYGGPCKLRTRAGHVEVWILHGLLVDPTTGTLTTVAWAVPADEDSKLAPATLVRLGPRLVYTCGLDVIAERALGTVPVNWSFAACSLPPGDLIVVPPNLREEFLRARTVSSRAGELEGRLRTLLGATGPSPALSIRP